LSRSARYTFILIVVALSACLAAFGGWRFARASAPVNGPIILISVDSLRADHLPVYGYRSGEAPAIDSLGADGIVFERSYSHVPQTLPAHASLLTGRLPFETDVRDGAGFTLSGSVRTIAEMLKDRGYATGGVVSSFLLRRDTGIARGFTFFDGELPQAPDGDPEPLMRDAAASEEVAEHWLDSVGTSRVFLFLHLAEPRRTTAAAHGFETLPPYDGQIAVADAAVGQLVKYLKAHQLYDRSTIFLLSDHGQGLGDHGEQTHGLLAYEEALHVPLIIKTPAGEGTQRHVGAPVQLIDVVPTILDLAKAPRAGGLRGRSLTPVMNGGTIDDAPIYAESLFGDYRFGMAPLFSLIQGRYQFIAAGEHVELLDLESAPADRHDIHEEQPDLMRNFRTQLASLVPRGGAAKAGPVTETDRDRFERLGYVGVPGVLVTDVDDAPVPMERVEFVERYRAAVRLSRTGEAREAIDAWRSLLRDEPTSADLWEHLARTGSRLERNDVAIDAWKHVLDLTPGSISAQIGLASSSLRARRLDDAAVHAEAIVDEGSADAVQKAEAHELLARIAIARKDPDTARAEAARAEEADAARPVKAFVEGRLALDEGRYADGADSFDRALDAAKKAGRAPLADLRVYAADALVHVGRADDAEALLETELRLFPANVRARTALQSLYRASGRASEAAALAQH
jgi:arylsulfatase A-like enzyme